MANDDRNYVIKVTKDAQGYHTRLLEGGAPKNGDLDFNKNADGLKKTAHYKLDFTIDNSDLADPDKVRFAPDDSEVMAVHTDLSQCPQVGSQMQDTFWVDKNNTGSKLRLINMDLKVQKLRFKINLVKVSDPAARPFIELDPIINNGNQGTAEPMTDFAWAPLLTGAIVGLGTVAAVSSSFVPATALVFAVAGAIVGLIVGVLLDRM